MSIETPDLSGPWKPEMYEEHLPEPNAFDEGLIRSMLEFYKPRKSLDLGCGLGYFVKYLRDQGVDAWGSEPEDMGEHFKSQGHQILKDLSKPFDLKEKYDLVICLEVVEHIPRDFEDIVFDNIVRHMSRYLLFSGATVGQYGTGHINERPEQHWFAHLVRRGLVLHHQPSSSLRQACALPWYANNVSIWELAHPVSHNLADEVAERDSSIMSREALLRSLHAQINDLQSQLHETRSELEQTQNQLSQYTQLELGQVYSQLQQVQLELGQNQAQLQQTQAELEQTHGQLQQTQAELVHNQTQLQQTQAELEHNQTQLEQTQAELKQTHSELQQVQLELGQNQTQLQQTQAELEQTHSELQQVQLELGQNQTQLQQTQAELKQNQTQLQQTQAEVSKMRSSSFWKLREVFQKVGLISDR